MKTTLIVLAFLTCTLSGCGEVNTRFAWPWTYGAHGCLAFLVALAICGLIYLSLGLVVASEDPKMVAGGVTFLVVAWLVLQLLPHTEQGMQFIPLPPWFYGTWYWRAASYACWTTLLLGSLIAFATDRNAAAFILVAFGLNALLSFATPLGATAEPSPSQSVENTIAQWEKLKDERQGALARLLSDKEELLSRIRGLGAKDRTELMANPVGRTLVEELEQLCRQIAKAKGEAEMVETTVECAKSRLRTIERQALLNGGLTDKDYERMSAVTHILEEELRKEQVPGTEVRLDRILDEVFAGEKK